VRLDPEGEWSETLRRAAALARACQTRLEVAALVGEDGSLERLAESAAGLSDTTFFVFHRETRRSDAKLLARAGGLLKASAPGSRVGGGTDAWFADLNRNREAAQGADPVAFALCPQLHARDEATILENVASLPDMARTARGFAGRAELVLAPVGLAPPEESPDPRLASELGGEWVKRLLQSARTAGFSAITLRPGIGPGGIAATETPAWRVLRDR
jgi:hypothetical protein